MSDFEHHESFQPGDVTGHLQLDRYETVYQQLFSEALEDGVITEDERERLAKAADELGLDRSRLDSLEGALREAYESHHGFSVLDTGSMFAPRTTAGPTVDFVQSLQPPPPVAPKDASEEVTILRDRVAFLEARVGELEQQLNEARAQVSYEVDFSDLDAPVPSTALEGHEALHRRLRHDPRDATTLKSLFLAHGGNADRQFCVAQALVYLDQAEPIHRDIHQELYSDALIQPSTALDLTGWRRLLFHPDDEELTSDILAVVVSAVLLAHSAAINSAGKLPELSAERRLNPETSTVQAARCFGWAAQTLGMAPPGLFAAPDMQALATMVPTVPPVCSLGKSALSGRTPKELAFVAGQQLAYYRPERFIRMLVPDVVDLQDVFLAALAIGYPKLPLNADVRTRVEPISRAIEPLLEAREVDALRSAYKRFVEHGGIANLQRWGIGADLTAIRAGFCLSGDLPVAEAMLELGGSSITREAMDDLIIFVTGERYAKLRQQIGIALS